MTEFRNPRQLLTALALLLSATASPGHEEIPAYLADDVRLGERLNVSLVGSYQVEAPWDPAEGGYFSTTDLFISGNYAYMGSNAGVLHIIDISQPQAMELVAQVAMPGPALDVKVDGDLAIVAVQNGDVNELGLVVVDVSDPPNASVVSMVQDEYWSGVHNTFLDGDRAYLAHSASRGLTVVDLSIPEQPRISGTWTNELSGAASIIHDVFVDGGLAFLSDLPRGSGGLVILDLLDPDRPQTLATLPIAEGLHNCFRDGETLYCNQELGGWQRALHVIDISDPSRPQEVATHTMKRSSVGDGIGPHNTWVQDDLLYWAFYDSGVRILDVQEPTHPREIGYYRTPYAWSAQPHDDGLFYVADARLSSLRAFRFEPPGFTVRDAQLESATFAAGTPNRFAIQATVEPAIGSLRRLHQVTARLLPDRGMSWLLRDDGTGGDQTARDGLYTGTISLPPDLISGSYFVEVRAEDDTGGIYPYSDLPFELVPTRDLPILDDDLALENSSFHVEGGAQAPVFSSAGPVLQGEQAVAFQVQPNNSGGWHADLHFEDRLDFLGYSALRFALHPGDATGQTLTLGLGGFDVRLVGRRSSQRVHLNRDEWQIVEIPLDVFVRERSVPELGFSGDLRGTFYVDDMRLVSHRQVTTFVDAEASLPDVVELQQNYPNPFNAQTAIPFELATSDAVDLRVLDLLGQTVVVLADEVFPAGHHVIHWDGSSAGRSLATGVYFYRLRSGDRTMTRRLLLLR